MQIPDHVIRHKSDEEFAKQGGQYDQRRADRVKTYLEKCCVTEDGSGLVLQDWQHPVINSWYGFHWPNGLPRSKICFLSVPRKNGKTALVRGLCGYHLTCAGHPSPSVISCANNRAQAAQIFDGLRWDIENRPDLSAALVVKDYLKLIEYPAGNGRYRALSSESRGKYGTGHDYICFDELAFAGNDKLYTALKDAGAAKPHSQQAIISTAGWSKAGAFFRLYQHAKKIIGGEVIDVAFQPWIWEVADPDKEDLDSPETWARSNPSLGVLFSEQDFRIQWERDKQNVSSRLEFLRLRQNCWSETEAGWLSVELLDASRAEFPPLTKASPVYVACDAGQLSDISVVVAIFPINGKYYVKCWGLVPSMSTDEDDTNLVTYQQLALDGSLKIIPGQVASIEDDLKPIIDKLIKDHTVKSITVDRWQLGQLAEQYEKRGIQVYRFAPNHYRFNAPCKATETALIEKKIVTEPKGNALLRWCMMNCTLSRNPKGYGMPAKGGGNEAAKIDAIVTLVMCMEQAILHDKAPPPPVSYKSRGILWA